MLSTHTAQSPQPRHWASYTEFMYQAQLNWLLVNSCDAQGIRILYVFWGFNGYIIVDLVKHSVLTLVREMWHYKNDRCYYYYLIRWEWDWVDCTCNCFSLPHHIGSHSHLWRLYIYISYLPFWSRGGNVLYARSLSIIDYSPHITVQGIKAVYLECCLSVVAVVSVLWHCPSQGD